MVSPWPPGTKATTSEADLMDADTLQGIEKIYEAKLTEDELVALHKSAAAVKELVDVMAPKLA
ncbi:MAG TPA: hypothetical protein VIL39_04400 [Verrucomicrobiae bacterium]